MRFFLISILSLTLVACGTVPAPKYQPSKENIEKIKTLEKSVDIGKFELKQSNVAKDVISIRAINMNSPYGTSFSDYLENALRLDFSLAEKLSEKSDLTMSGAILKNDLDGSGINVGTGIAEVEVKINKGGNSLMRKIYTQEHQWESSFMGAEAIPKAMQQYPILIEKLIYKIVSDPDFNKATKE